MFLRLLAPAYVLAAFLLCSSQANAQTPDSAYFNLGRVKLLKSSTQHVTVKAEDLQRFPSANLSEAVNVWFSGFFSDAGTLVYVIDGNLATDVNQYPVYDIEEITFIQNAVTQLNGVSQQQQLVLVTTKRNLTGNSGITAVAQGSLVKLQTNRIGSNASSTGSNAYYQQYHLSAYKNINQVHFGVSANYLRDVMPGFNISTRTDLVNPQIKRWRFNGYFNARLWEGTVLDVTGGYVPQNNSQQIGQQASAAVISQAEINSKENLYNGSLNLHSQLLPGLTNELRGVYNNYTNDYNSNSFVLYYTGATPNHYSSTTTTNAKMRDVVIYDELRYSKTSGNFTFSPAVNFNYRNIKNSTLTSTANSNSSYSQNRSSLDGKTYLLTPTLTVSYNSAASLTAGFVQFLNSTSGVVDAKPKKFFPFVTASANVSKLIDTGARVNVNVYGSYAVNNRLNDTHTTLSFFYPYSVTANYNSFATNIAVSDYINGKNFKTFTLGSTVGLFQNKLELSYNYDNRKSFSSVYYLYNNNQSFLYLADTRYKTHRIGVGYNWIKQDNINWKTQINATNLKQEILSAPVGNIIILNTFNRAWTGGWTNRLQYKNFVGGIDLLYLFGKNNGSISSTLDLDSFALQNLYAGWRIKTSKLKGLEVYASGRNLFQNKQSVLPDYRRYIGIGLHASL